MWNIHDMAPEIQGRVSKFWRNLSSCDFSLPERKFVGELLFAQLKKPAVYVTKMAHSLEETISPKKTWERLNRNLRREGLGDRLLSAHLAHNANWICRMRFCLIDTSDIQKEEAKKIEGLCRVRDGDKSSKDSPVIGNGLHWINGVMADTDGILPVSSELYSLDLEGTSENRKIIGITELVASVHPDAIFVYDRGGDRAKLIDEFLLKERKFIIRGCSRRSLRLRRDGRKLHNIEQIARSTKCKRLYKSARGGKLFYLGCRRVYYQDHPLMLVVSRRPDGAMSWYLTNTEGTRQEIMDTVMEGYGLRWRIEEYHRQIKQDYKLESIRLRNYIAIKNMVVFIMLAASFVARLPKDLTLKFISMANLLQRMKLRDIPDYPYYRITAAVSHCLALAKKRRPTPLWIRRKEFWQYQLPLTLC